MGGVFPLRLHKSFRSACINIRPSEATTFSMDNVQSARGKELQTHVHYIYVLVRSIRDHVLLSSLQVSNAKQPRCRGSRCSPQNQNQTGQRGIIHRERREHINQSGTLVPTFDEAIPYSHRHTTYAITHRRNKLSKKKLESQQNTIWTGRIMLRPSRHDLRAVG